MKLAVAIVVQFERQLGFRPALICLLSQVSRAEFSGARLSSAGVSQPRLRSTPWRLNRVRPFATPSLLAIGKSHRQKRLRNAFASSSSWSNRSASPCGDPVAAGLPGVGASLRNEHVMLVRSGLPPAQFRGHAPRPSSQ